MSFGTQEAIRTSKRRPSTSVLASGWLDNLILALEVVQDASAMTPFPYVKFAAGIVVQILLRIQTVRRNRDDFLDLSRKLVDVIITLRDTLCSSYQNRSPPPEFTLHCFKFVKLLALQMDINEVVRQTKGWASFINSSEITSLISLYRGQVDDLRSNFTLDAIVRLSLKSEEQPLAHLPYTSDVLYFVDAMNDRVPVALDHCINPAEFNDYVKFRFRKRVGRAIVERGYYSLCLQLVAGTQQPLDSRLETWMSLVKPGVTITMDILVKAELEDIASDSCRCPSCLYLCNGASLGDEVKCSHCTTSFRISRGSIEDLNTHDALSDATHRPMALSIKRPLQIPEYSNDACDIRYFRRFRVFMDALRESTCVLVAEDNPIARQILVKQLQRLQLNVIATGNGEEALAEWEARGPGYFSAALFDHHMPICDGAEATKRLRHMENERNCTVFLPVVALSADCQDSTRQLCLSAGMNAFFNKPVKKGDFTSMLSMLGKF